MSRLDWISDRVLEDAADHLFSTAVRASEEAAIKVARNVVDPFASLVLATTVNVRGTATLAQVQNITQLSKAVSNAIGTFHQVILAAAPGFHNRDRVYDLENSEKRIIVEVKNKFNTMNAKTRKRVEDELRDSLAHKEPGWTAYLVIIIPRGRKRYTKKLSNREVYEIDGASFYTLATGHDSALQDLYMALEDIAKEKDETLSHDILEQGRKTMELALPK